MWPFKKKPVGRKVVLNCQLDNAASVFVATETQSGWLVRTYGDEYVRLIKDGSVVGRFFSKWYPHSGWDGTEKHFDK